MYVDYLEKLNLSSRIINKRHFIVDWSEGDSTPEKIFICEE